MAKEDGVKQLIHQLIRGESGQDLIEYALLVSFLALVSVAALNILGTSLAGFYQDLQARLSQM
jgi:Flp pilus assembly pilin Flp